MHATEVISPTALGTSYPPSHQESNVGHKQDHDADTSPSSSIVSSASSEVVDVNGKSDHYGDWPNDAGFNFYEDVRSPVVLKTTGSFPSWTAGTLLRTGPGTYKYPVVNQKRKQDFELRHWFDGFTRLHKFTITPDAGATRITYQSRSQVDELIEKARTTGRLEGFSFAQKRDPCDTFYHKVKSVFQKEEVGLGMANIGVAIRPVLGNDKSSRNLMNLTTDASGTKQFDVETLEATSLSSQDTLHPDLKGPISSAHSCLDPVTGDLYNYNLAFGRKSVYRVFCSKADGSGTDILATISDTKGAYIHSLFLTQHFVILCVWPSYFAAGGAKILWERNVLDALEFDSSAECQWIVVDRSTKKKGVVARFESPAMFCFHSVNAWEEDGEKEGEVSVMAELCEFENMNVLHQFYYENIVSNGKHADWFKDAVKKSSVSLARYELSGIKLDAPAWNGKKKGRAIKVMDLKEPGAGDLPQINSAYRGKKHRYVYTVITRGLSSFADAIGKSDTQTETAKLWSRAKHTPGEPIFVARPGGTEEDDGVLLTVVLNGEKGTSYLLCLDARTLEEIAMAECPVPVGFGFHGAHLASNAPLASEPGEDQYT